MTASVTCKLLYMLVQLAAPDHFGSKGWTGHDITPKSSPVHTPIQPEFFSINWSLHTTSGNLH